MARKRMISPEIWESQSFGELSMLAKVLFIGMISHADDDGKGVLSAQLLKSKILPFDELRIADIDKALNEIGHNVSVAKSADTDKALNERGHKLSVVFYEVQGRRYYLFENWRKWQTINRPIPSKLPNPPVADGEGEGILFHEVFSEQVVNTHGVISECSRAKEDIKESNKDNDVKASSNKLQQNLNEFCEEYGVKIDSCSSYLDDMDFMKLSTAYSQSKKFLQVHPLARTLSWIIKNYASILAGKYKDKTEIKGQSSAKTIARDRSAEILDNLYNRFSDMEVDDDKA